MPKLGRFFLRLLHREYLSLSLASSKPESIASGTSGLFSKATLPPSKPRSIDAHTRSLSASGKASTTARSATPNARLSPSRWSFFIVNPVLDRHRYLVALPRRQYQDSAIIKLALANERIGFVPILTVPSP